MSQITLELTDEIEGRVNAWCRATNGEAEDLMSEALLQYLEDWEDYTDAIKICAEIDSGRMRTYSREEINREMDARGVGS